MRTVFVKILKYLVSFFPTKEKELIQSIGLATHHKKVVALLSGFGLKPNDSYNNQPSYKAKTIFKPHIFYISKSTLALQRKFNYIQGIVVFREDESAQLPYNLKWDDSVAIIESKMKMLEAIKSADHWRLNKKGGDYLFSLDFETNTRGNKTIYSYYLDALPETKEVKGIGTFNFDGTTWHLEKEIAVAWSPFLMLPQLEDHKDTFTKENVLFIENIFHHKTLKIEIENLVYTDYQDILQKYPSIEKQADVNTPKDSWKLLEISGLWIYNNQTISMRFLHSALWEYAIVISGKIGSLELKHIRVSK